VVSLPFFFQRARFWRLFWLRVAGWFAGWLWWFVQAVQRLFWRFGWAFRITVKVNKQGCPTETMVR